MRWRPTARCSEESYHAGDLTSPRVLGKYPIPPPPATLALLQARAQVRVSLQTPLLRTKFSRVHPGGPDPLHLESRSLHHSSLPLYIESRATEVEL